MRGIGGVGTIRSTALLRDLWLHLDREGVRYCLLRGPDRLDPPPGDVDLLLHPADVEVFHAVAGRLGFALLRRWCQGTQHHLLGLDAGRRVAVHAVTEVGFAGPDFPWRLELAGGVLDRAVPGGPLEPVTASPADEFWLLLHHCLLDKDRVAAHHRVRLVELAPAASIDDPAAAHLPGEVRRRLVELAARGEWDAVLEMTPAVRAAVRDGQHLAGQFRHWRRLAELQARRWLERVARRGVSVALLAPDGAGKSTLSDTLPGALPLPSHRAYLGLYPAQAAHPAWRVKGLSFAVRLGRLWRTWLMARVWMARGRAVIFDRHTLDARVSAPTGRRAAARSWVLAHALPLPDRVVILDAPGAVLHDRSGEHDPAHLERQRQGYLELARQVDRAVVVDATSHPDEVLARTVELVWQLHLDRHRTRGRT